MSAMKTRFHTVRPSVRIDVVHVQYSVVVRELFLEDAAAPRRRSSAMRRTAVLRACTSARIASGFSQSAQAPETSMARKANDDAPAAPRCA